MSRQVDLTGYWKLLRAIFGDPPRRKRKGPGAKSVVPTPTPEPPATLVDRPTLDRAEVRGRVLAIIQAADRAIEGTAGHRPAKPK